MGLGASIVIFAIGAILKFGVTATTNGIDLQAIGVILMLVGLLGGLASAIFLASWSPWAASRRTTVVRDSTVPGDTVRETTVRRERFVE